MTEARRSRKKTRVTSLDIAHRAGVSQATVSRVLAGSPLVNAETRRRVELAVRELNYKVDRHASSLRTQRAGTLALLLFEDPTQDDSHINPFFLSMLGSITRACARHGHDLLVSFQQLSDDWHATDALDFTLGLRYTRETKDLHSVYTNPNGSPGCASYFGPTGVSAAAIGRIAAALTARGVPFASLPAANQQALISNIVGYSCLPWANAMHNGRVTDQSRSENEWSGTVKAAYRWNEHAMTYLSYARGYKAGGFNMDRVQSSTGLSSGGAGITPVNDTSFPGEFVDS